jgi:ABC-2 type transport system permease protein
MRWALRMEWTKLRTIRATGWSLLALVVTTVGVSAFTAARIGPIDCAPRPCTLDTARIALSGVYIGQIAVVVLAALAVTTEYDTRTIATTLQAEPRRWRVVIAKAWVVLGVVLGAGALAVAGCVVAGRVVLTHNGFTPAAGYPSLLGWGDGAVRRALLGTVAYLGLIALLSLGIAAILRAGAAAITTVLGLLYVVPIAAQFVTDRAWQLALARVAPMTAGLAIQSTQLLDGAPIGPWAGLGVVAAYAAAALIAGAILFQLRDA